MGGSPIEPDAAAGFVLDPADTFALVVGVERYETSQWALPGPANDAIRFCNWLKARGVPDDRVRLFLSPLDGQPSEKRLGNWREQPADSDEIYNFIEREVSERPERLLLVYWGGHGLSDASGDRLLLTADAKKKSVRHLSMTRIRTFLRCGSAPGRQHQVFILDTCGNLRDLEGLERGIGGYEFPEGTTRPEIVQVGLMASHSGEPAENLDARTTGLYSEHLRHILAGEPVWPPHFGRVHMKLKVVFADLIQQQKAIQTPYYVSWAAASPWGEGDSAEPRVVSKGVAWRDSCDRSIQEAEFANALRRHFPQQDGPLSVFIYGPMDEGHGSLRNRLLLTVTRPIVERKLGAGARVFDIAQVPWPDPTLPADRQQEALRHELAKKLDIAQDPIRAQDLMSSSDLRNYPAIVFSHRIILDSWTESLAETLRWYVDDYWGAYKAVEGSPRVLLFVLLVLKSKTALRPSAFAKFKSTGAVVPLPALEPVSLHDIEQWLMTLPGKDERALMELAARVFEEAKPPASLERRTFARALMELAAKVFDEGKPPASLERRTYVSVQEAWDRLDPDARLKRS